jgi:uncharacterized protein YraI
MTVSSWKPRRILLMLFALLLTGALTVSAQGIPTPITVGANVIGEISPASPSPSYVLNNTTPQQITVQVIAITQGFLPSFDIVDPSGVVITTSANNGTQNVVAAAPALANIGIYTIRVMSANGQQGQFLISLQPGVPLQPPLPITVGQVVEATVSAESGRAAYSFTASPTNILLLTVRSAAPSSGPIVMLKDATTSQTLAVASAQLIGVRYRLPIGTVNYLVEVTHTGAQTPEPFVLCLENESGAPVCPAPAGVPIVQSVPTATPVPAQATATLVPLPQTGSCVVASATGGAVNVRSGPGTNYSILTQLAGNGTAAVIARLPDNSWLQISINGLTGWISTSVTRLGGQCGLIAAVTLTPTLSAPTFTPTNTLPGPTATSTFTPTNTLPGPTATSTLTETPTLTPTEPLPVATLNLSLPPNNGSMALTSGFVPDPFTVAITSGGAADVSYLGGGCTGFASSAPDFSVNYTSGAFPTLRFYFVGSGDTTMIINSPSGSYTCVDDSFGGLNPTIDFNSPASGRYDVWIGSFASGTFVSGTLSVTENTGNHP